MDTSHGSDAIGTITVTETSSTDKNLCVRQYVRRLASGQTITGSQAVSFVARFQESGSGNNMNSAFGIRVIAGDGSTLRKEVLAVARESNEMSNTTLQSRNNTATSAATNYTTQEGDFLVIEIGGGGDPGGSSPHTFDISLGDNAASDLDASDVDTGADNPWAQLNDTLTFLTDLLISVSDNIPATSAWADAASIRVDIPKSFSEALTLVEQAHGALFEAPDGYWKDASAYNLAVEGADFTKSASDSLNNWADAILLGWGGKLTDDGGNLADTLSVLRWGNVLSDSNTLSDGHLLGWGGACADDANNLADAIRLGYGAFLTDDAGNLADAATALLGIPEPGADSLNNWADEVHGALFVGWNDSIVSFLSGTSDLPRTVIDDLNSLADDITRVGWGIPGIAETLTVPIDAATVTLGYPTALADDLNNLVDAAALRMEHAPATIADDLNFWSDAGQAVEFALLPLMDDEVSGIGYGNLVADDAFALADAAPTLQLVAAGFVFTFSDAFTQADAILLAYGHVVTDSILLTDAITPNIGLKLADDAGNLADSAAVTMQLRIAVEDTAQGLWFDSPALSILSIELTRAIADSITTWNDAVLVNLSVNIGLAVADQMPAWADAIALVMRRVIGPVRVSGTPASATAIEKTTEALNRLSAKTNTIVLEEP